MNLERLMRADLSELAGRGAQEARKWLERSHLAAWGAPESATMPAEIERAALGVRGAVAGPGPSRFFRGALGGGARLVASGDPAWLRSTQAEAAELLAGRFDLLGYRGLGFGAPIDWHLDAVSGTRAPRVHWSRLRPLDRGQVGDSKVVWELNRCQWWVTLARAHALTGDPIPAGAIAGHAHAWREANPIGRGINWASSLEVSLRLVSWCWTAFLTRGDGGLTAAELQPLLLGIRDHACHVARYLSHHYSPNTHLTGEALGLFIAGTALPELEEASGWRESGARILVEQLDKQVLADGVHFEQAACYQRYTAEFYLHFLILAAHSGFTVPPAVRAGLVRLLDHLLAIRRPDGSLPAIGDADGGWLLPLAARAPDDLRGVFSTAAAWLGRADYAWAAGGLAPETLWLLGEEGHDAFHALQPAPPARPPSIAFAEGGLAVMRSDWSATAHQLILDAGPLGCPVSSGHGHADLLALQCSVFGEPVIVDPGTGVYGEAAWRDRMRVTSAHSTITIDGEEQAEPVGLFGWKQHPRARLLHWSPEPLLEVADASHDAYARLPDPVLHRRRVLFVDRRFWVVIDDLDGAAEHRVALRFQFAPMPVALEAAGDAEWVRARTPGGHALLLRSFALRPFELELHQGEADPALGWVSPAYGQRQPATLLVARATARLPLRVATLLYPLAAAGDERPPVRAMLSPLGPVGLAFGDGRIVQFGSGA